MDTLEEEYYNNIDILDNREIFVHPSVCLIENRHIEYEKQHLRSGSTFKGGGSYLAERVLRNSQLKPFKGFKNIKPIDNYHDILTDLLNTKNKILIEGSQGTDLSLYNTKYYPYVTSRPVSVAQMLSDSEISPMRLNKSIMVIRPFPIRISKKTELGIEIDSGHCGNSTELSWKQIGIGSHLGQYPTTIDDDIMNEYVNTIDITEEKTTVTKQTRRVFNIDINQLKHNVGINTPSGIYLNFFQYLGKHYENINGDYKSIYIDKYQREYINWLESELSTPIIKLGTGSDIKSVIDIKSY